MDPLADYNPFYNTEHYIDGQHNGGVYNSGNLNPYVYCYQNPLRYIDPNGKQVDMQEWNQGMAIQSYTWGWIGDARAGVLNLTSRLLGSDDRFEGDGFFGYNKIPKQQSQGVFWDFFNATIGVLSARYGISGNTLLAVKQGAGTLREFREVIQSTKALDKFAVYGKCKEFSGAFKKAFGGKLMKIESQGTTMSVYNKGKDIGIGSDTHYFIEKMLDGKTYIFDNMHKNGVLKDDYIKGLGGYNKSKGLISGESLYKSAKEVKK